ncbi:unnamed protein product [Pedinophyceae sp. YPF-701]|nr:unnamed protein product [Pedinophyceae sp. YPF-701]
MRALSSQVVGPVRAAGPVRPRTKCLATGPSKDEGGIAPQVPRRAALLAATSALAVNPAPIGRSGIAAMGSATAADAPIPRAELAPGLPVSRIVKGCWQLSGAHRGDRATDRTTGAAAVEDFGAYERAGITAFDTADIYGPSEGLIGKYVKERGGAKGLQILTKAAYFGRDMLDVSQAAVDAHVGRSLRALNVDRVDLVQLYWHDYNTPGYVDAARGLADLQRRGVIGAVGATNFDEVRLQEIADAGVQVKVHQVQYSLLDRRVEGGMTDWCKKNGCTLLPYGVLAGGFLTDKYVGVPARDVELDTSSKRKYSSIIQNSGGWGWFQELLAALAAVGKKHGVSVASVATRWVLDRPCVPAVLIGARNARHAAEHKEAFAFEFDDADRREIDAVLAKGKQPTSMFYSWERGASKW